MQVYYNNSWRNFYPMISNIVPDRRPTHKILEKDKIYGKVLLRASTWTYLTVNSSEVKILDFSCTNK